MELLAHSENREGQVHLLADHLREAEQLARQFGSRFACSELAVLVALYNGTRQNAEKRCRSYVARWEDWACFCLTMSSLR